jgi:3,4-dihydroxy 2-butanone 4-phosphate synthase/GTP cyclohydrolase II
MNEDGSMSRMAQLEKVAEQYHLPIITIQDIFNYRVSTETLIYEEISAHIPMEKFRDFEMLLFKNDFDDLEHFVLYKKLINPQQPPLVRIHSECVTGDLFGSLRCDCGKQLEQALQMIDAEGGVLIYLRQEGRGIGLSNKLKAYSLQDTGLDTVEANIELGLPVDNREYHLAYQFLKHLGYQTIRLITNNPLKIEALEFFGVKVAERISLVVQTNPDNQKYIDTKIQKLGHLINKD